MQFKAVSRQLWLLPLGKQIEMDAGVVHQHIELVDEFAAIPFGEIP